MGEHKQTDKWGGALCRNRIESVISPAPYGFAQNDTNKKHSLIIIFAYKNTILEKFPIFK